MKQKSNKLIFIEQLNLITFLVSSLLRIKRNSPDRFYVDKSAFFGKLCNLISKILPRFPAGYQQVFHHDFPGSWYEQNEETGQYVNDGLFSRYKKNVYVHSVLQFGGCPDYELAIRKELYNRYTYNRVKAFIFLKYLSMKYDTIDFLPLDPEHIVDLLSENQRPSQNYSVPGCYHLLLTALSYARRIVLGVAYPFLLLFISIRLIIKGISRNYPCKKSYCFGIDTFGEGIPWRVPYNSFFIYNKSDFHPSRVLHVLRSSLKDERTCEKFRQQEIPYTQWNNQKIPVGYLICRILVDMIVRQTICFFTGIVSCNKKSIFLFPSLAVAKMTVESEIFYLHYDLKVFIARDDYSSLHIVRTLVANKNNCFTVGFMHGDYTIPGTESSIYLLFDRYGVYGTFYPKLHKNGQERCHPEIIGAGIYGLDKTFHLAQKGYFPQKYNELKQSYKIILIVGGPFNENDTDSGFTKDLMIKYYEDILTLTDEYTEYYRIIKPAGDDRLDEDLKRIIEKHERVIIDKQLWTYKIILISDLTFVYASCTVGLESLMAGKRVIYYDLYNFKNHVYKKYSPLLVAQDIETLKENIKSVLRNGNYLDPDTIKLIQSEHGSYFDGRVVHRFRQLCRNLIKQSIQEKNEINNGNPE